MCWHVNSSVTKDGCITKTTGQSVANVHNSESTQEEGDKSQHKPAWLVLSPVVLLEQAEVGV